jgi:hypothetical protein
VSFKVKSYGSAVWSASNQLAVPDDDNALRRRPLFATFSFSVGGLLVCRYGAPDNDDSVATFRGVHGGPLVRRLTTTGFTHKCTDDHIAVKELLTGIER